jgi:membrane-bound lytic murein transglycosylase F
VIPRFAGDQADSLYVPEANLRAGTRLMKAIWNRYAYLDSLDRTRFALAEYHAGNGHVTDARRLAMDLGRNPNQWEGSLAATLPLLMEQRWFSRTRHGFYRGTRTVDYVEEILARYRAYTRLLPLDGTVPDSLRLALPEPDAAVEPTAVAADRPPPE